MDFFTFQKLLPSWVGTFRKEVFEPITAIEPSLYARASPFLLTKYTNEVDGSIYS
jgi:hypothetical protein